MTSFNFWRRLITTWNIFWVKIGFLFDFVWPNFQIETYFALTFSKLVQNLSSCSWSHLLMSNKNAINAYSVPFLTAICNFVSQRDKHTEFSTNRKRTKFPNHFSMKSIHVFRSFVEFIYFFVKSTCSIKIFLHFFVKSKLRAICKCKPNFLVKSNAKW